MTKSQLAADSFAETFTRVEDPFPAEKMKDNEITIGTPIYRGITQYPLFSFGTGEPGTLQRVVLHFDREVLESLHTTLYLVQEAMNRTILKKNWVIGPHIVSRTITHEINLYLDKPHKYLLHFHSGDTGKPAEIGTSEITGYVHSCVSSTF
jgi:hypothetical protein